MFKLFINAFTSDYLNAVDQSNNSTVRIDSLSDLVSEIHAIISAEKPTITRTTLKAIQESREACGGHGYLKAARLGDLRNIQDPSLTYEGDNNVLVQQTSNWLLRQWSSVNKEFRVASPLDTCSFLTEHKSILARSVQISGIQDVLNRNFIKNCFEWLITYLLSKTAEEQSLLIKNGDSNFEARNKTQVYKCALISRAYSELVALKYFWMAADRLANNRELKTVLDKLGVLYGLSCLDQHLIYFYEGGYARDKSLAKMVKDGVLQMCTTLKPDIIGVVDALAPPDFVVNSVLGNADGEVYKNLEQEFFNNPGAMSRPHWWHEIIVRDAPDLKLLSKL